MITLAIAEDKDAAMQVLEEKLANYPEVNVALRATNGKQIVELLENSGPVDAILMDIEMPIMDGVQATEIIRQKFPSVKIIMLTIYDDDNMIMQAIQAGANSYILKDTSRTKLFETITDTLNGGSVMSPSVASKTLSLFKQMVAPRPAKGNAVQLSARETGILELINQGHTNKAIAAQLFISPFTVKRHIENIYQKLQANNRIGLLEKARDQRLL